ncbi:MAG: DNA-binding protein [Clostridiales bacterium]|nr:DNA-binding protein [Clostridiales bacterium]
MSRKDGRDYLYLIWKEPISRRNFIIGQLSKNSQYEFTYGHEVDQAIKEGFELLIPFENIDKVYKSDTLFPTFSSRLPDAKRRGIDKILTKYDLKEFDEYKLLKKSGARLPIDTLEFIDPIFEESNGEVERNFYIAGVRYYIGCDGAICEEALNLSVEDSLSLDLEPTNQYDGDAIKVVDMKNNHLGYLPRYYSAGITEYLEQGASYECKVLEVNKDMECHECIKVKLRVYIDVKGRKKIS